MNKKTYQISQTKSCQINWIWENFIETIQFYILFNENYSQFKIKNLRCDIGGIVYLMVVASNPWTPNQIIVGMSDGAVHVVEPLLDIDIQA